jgi:hypothetical protein
MALTNIPLMNLRSAFMIVLLLVSRGF